MANIAVNTLDVETPLGSDHLFGIGASKEYRALVSDVAKYIVENYAGSIIGGSAQTLQALLNQTASRFTQVSSGSIFDITEAGLYFLTGAVTDKPAVTGNSRGSLIVIKYQGGGNTYLQYIFIHGVANGEIHKCLVYNTTNYGWEKIWPASAS